MSPRQESRHFNDEGKLRHLLLSSMFPISPEAVEWIVQSVTVATWSQRAKGGAKVLKGKGYREVG